MQRASRAWATPLCALFAAVPIAVATPQASADDGRGFSIRIGSNSHSYGHRTVAGHLTIDHRTYTLYDTRDFHAQVASAFKRAGYHAWCRDNRVIVDFRDCHPAVRWSGACYSVGYVRSHGRLEVCFTRKHQSRPVHHSPPFCNQPVYKPSHHGNVTFSASYRSAHHPTYRRQYYKPRNYGHGRTYRYSTWGRGNTCY